MPRFSESALRVEHRIAEMTMAITASDAPLNRIIVRRSAGENLEERSLRKAIEPFADAVEKIKRGFSIANFSPKDCIEITTTEGTTIRINCPIITLGEPTIE